MAQVWAVRLARRAGLAASFALALAAALVLMVPAAGDPVALAAPLSVADANSFGGTPAVGALFYESLESMLVTVKSPTAVGPTNNFGEIFTVVDNDSDPSNGIGG